MGFLTLMAVALLIIIGSLVGQRSVRKFNASRDRVHDQIPSAVPTVALVVGCALAAFFLAYNVFVVIPTGHVGVGTIFGKPQETVYTEGLNTVNPLVDMHRMKYRTVSYQIQGPHSPEDKTHPEMGGGAVNILTKDQLRVWVDVTVNYSLYPNDAVFLLRYFGEDYADTLIKNPAHAAIRDAAQVYNFEQLTGEKRETVAEEMRKHLETSVKQLLKQHDPKGQRPGMVVQQIFLKRITPPLRLVAAIEAKLEADQQSQQMQFVLTKEKQEAERKEIEARGIQKFQDIVSQGINERLLVWKGIEASHDLAKSPNSKVVIIGSQGTGLPLMLGNMMDQLEKDAAKVREAKK